VKLFYTEKHVVVVVLKVTQKLEYLARTIQLIPEQGLHASNWSRKQRGTWNFWSRLEIVLQLQRSSCGSQSRPEAPEVVVASNQSHPLILNLWGRSGQVEVVVASNLGHPLIFKPLKTSWSSWQGPEPLGSSRNKLRSSRTRLGFKSGSSPDFIPLKTSWRRTGRSWSSEGWPEVIRGSWQGPEPLGSSRTSWGRPEQLEVDLAPKSLFWGQKIGDLEDRIH